MTRYTIEKLRKFPIKRYISCQTVRILARFGHDSTRLLCNPNFPSQDELCCPICFEEYEDNQNSERLPKLLMCLHTFCVACIKNIRNRIGTVLCPICRFEHKDVSLTDLFDNYVILNFLKNQQIEEDAVMAQLIDDEEVEDSNDDEGTNDDEVTNEDILGMTSQFRQLAETTLCSLVVFNKKRSGEAQIKFDRRILLME